jgi:hypothetical protein
LHFDMPIEDRTPLAIIPHVMTDDRHSHGILLNNYEGSAISALGVSELPTRDRPIGANH